MATRSKMLVGTTGILLQLARRPSYSTENTRIKYYQFSLLFQSAKRIGCLKMSESLEQFSFARWEQE